MHLHAYSAGDQGPPVPVCPGVGVLPAPRRADATGLPELMACDAPLRSPTSDDEIMRRTIAIMTRYDVRGALSGDDRARARRWQAAAPGRF